MRKLRLLQGITVLSFLVCFLTCAVAQELHRDVNTETESILSDTSGEIEELVLQCPSSFELEVLPTYKSFLKQIESDTIVHIVCENAPQVEWIRIILESWRVENIERFRVTNVNREITVWARDRFVVKSTKDNLRKRIVVLPPLSSADSNAQVNDRKVPEIIARANGECIESRELALFFEGGNIVTSDKYLFTGYSTVMDSKLPSENEVVNLLESEFGKKVIVIGAVDTYKSQDHIDMYLTPISDEVVLLGDPLFAEELLADIWGEYKKERPQFAWEWGVEKNVRDKRLFAPTENVLRFYEQAKKQLEYSGFKVERIPVVHDEHGCAITYNNVLMEIRNGKRIVYMPVYGIEKLDAVATGKFRSLGFEVRPIDVSGIYRFGGTLRCITNVLARRTVRDTFGNFKIRSNMPVVEPFTFVKRK